MKIRDSGMPEIDSWESFFDAAQVLRALGFGPAEGEVADLGCGYGTFSMAAARLTSAPVHAFDIDPAMIEVAARRARRLGLSNVHAVERDIIADGSGLPDDSVSFAMLFNVLHAEKPEELMSEALRVLRPRGILGVIHWIHEASTPRGPDLSIRPRPEQCRGWGRQVGFVSEDAPILLPPYHFGLVLRKPG
jgi:SAM-dependent methyltransferase